MHPDHASSSEGCHTESLVQSTPTPQAPNIPKVSKRYKHDHFGRPFLLFYEFLEHYRAQPGWAHFCTSIPSFLCNAVDASTAVQAGSCGKSQPHCKQIEGGDGRWIKHRKEGKERDRERGEMKPSTEGKEGERERVREAELCRFPPAFRLWNLSNQSLKICTSVLSAIPYPR